MSDNLHPSSFDPAVHLHSELPDPVWPEPESSTLSDEIEAFYQVRQETAQENYRKGIVIQSRSWKLSDVFRSDEDVELGMSFRHH